MRQFDIARVTEMVAQGFLVCQKHPTEDLSIYNYSQRTQYEGYWNDITLACRGLILDSQGYVHASSFEKFFNYGQKEAVVPQNRGFVAYEKMDGSYIGSYWVNGEVYLNTKGSFTFDYVKMATHILNTRYTKAKSEMIPKYTYVFELIFPAGRIVLDYGDRQDLVLLAVFDIETGAELPLSLFDFMGFSLPKSEFFPKGGEEAIKELMSRNITNQEGYVIKFQAESVDFDDRDSVRALETRVDNLTFGRYVRVKVKFEEYVYLHRIITNVTSYDIYDALRREGGVPESLLERVPDEFYAWVRAYEAKLFAQYRHMAEIAFGTYFDIVKRLPKDFTRLQFYKAAGLYGKPMDSLTMSIYDLNFTSFKKVLWTRLKPPFEKPFQFAEKQLASVMAAVTDATQEIEA